MREFLFCGKRTDNGKWAYGYLSFVYVDGKNENGFIYTDKAQIYSQEDCQSYEVLTSTLGQFIGHSDEKGKKIFEGNICDVKRGSEIWRVTIRDIRHIPNELFGSCVDWIRIVGNYHDDPELLVSTSWCRKK